LSKMSSFYVLKTEPRVSTRDWRVELYLGPSKIWLESSTIIEMAKVAFSTMWGWGERTSVMSRSRMSGHVGMPPRETMVEMIREAVRESSWED